MGNPYEKDNKGSTAVKKTKVIVDWDDVMFGKPHGIMFRLFDLGVAGLEKDRTTIFKNHVGDLCRGFSTQIKGDMDSYEAIVKFKKDLINLGNYMFDKTPDKLEYFLDRISDTVDQLNIKVTEG